MWSDQETERDCLGYMSYVEVLSDLCLHKDLAPLTLGIFGSWGSGKTSLMRMLRSNIETATDLKKVKTLWFNAWRYEGRDEAQSALIHAILARLAEDKTLLEDAKDIFKRLKDGASVLKLGKFIGNTLLTMTPDIIGLIDCFREESERTAETMERFIGDFEDLLKRGKIDRVVVFIDDLDRCSNKEVIETFETIKLFLNMPICTFVVGADAERIEQAVGEVYKVIDSQRRKDYLEKIVQIPFTIPQQNIQDIACYVGMLVIGQHLDEAAWEQLSEARPSFYAAGDKIGELLCHWPKDNHLLFGSETSAVMKELQDVLPYVSSLARGLRGNPRQIKRFLNILSMRRQLAMANELEVVPDLLVKITVLEYVWGDFFNSLAETVDPETGRSVLLDEMLKPEDADRSMESKLVTDSLQKAGLLEYLLLEPKLDAKVDLRPYMFLAQTSLSRGRTPAIVPADEKARDLARSIESDDPLRSKIASQQTSAQEPSLVGAIVRTLNADLALAKEALTKTHIITGLQAICGKHKEHYEPCLKALSQIEPAGSEAIAIAATTFLTDAERHGVEVSDDLKARFTVGFKLAAALSGLNKPASRKREGK